MEKKSNSAYLDKCIRSAWREKHQPSVAPSIIPGPFRQQVARDMFAKLPADVRQSYKTAAEQDAKARREHYEAMAKATTSEDPVDRDAYV